MWQLIFHSVRFNALWVGLTLLEPQSRFGDKLVKFRIVCPQNGTAVLKGLSVKKRPHGAVFIPRAEESIAPPFEIVFA